MMHDFKHRLQKTKINKQNKSHLTLVKELYIVRGYRTSNEDSRSITRGNVAVISENKNE